MSGETVLKSMCHVCTNTESKYTCPCCSIRTCSLECSKEHKETNHCDGKRRKTDYVPIKEFTDQNMYSDLKFLEDVESEHDSAKRTITKFGPNVAQKDSRIDEGISVSKLPPRLKYLLNETEKRGIKLLLMPAGMTRRSENTTYYDKRNNIINWRIEWLLSSGLIKTVSKVSETTTCLEAFTSAMKLDPTNKTIEFNIETNVPGEAWERIEGDQQFIDIFKNRTIVEFPRIKVGEIVA